MQAKPFLFGANNFANAPGTTAVYHSLRPYRFWFIGDGLSTTQADALSLAAYNLMTAFGLSLV